MADFNVLDYALMAMALISTIVGLFRGFVKEIFSIITWLLAAYLGYSYGADLGKSFGSIETAVIQQTIGGGIIFFSVLIMGGLCGHLFSKVVKISGLSFMDKLLGGCLGITRSGLIALIIVPLLANTTAHEPWWQTSILVPKIQEVSNQVLSHVPEGWKSSLNDWSSSLTG